MTLCGRETGRIGRKRSTRSPLKKGFEPSLNFKFVSGTQPPEIKYNFFVVAIKQGSVVQILKSRQHPLDAAVREARRLPHTPTGTSARTHVPRHKQCAGREQYQLAVPVRWTTCAPVRSVVTCSE